MLAWRRALRSVIPNSVGGNGDARRERDDDDYELLLPSSSPPPSHHGHSHAPNNDSLSSPSSASLLPSSYHHHHRDHPHRRTRSKTISRAPTKLLRHCIHFFTLRRLCVVVLLVPVLLGVGILWSGIPPDFGDVREYERRLPQHRGLLVGDAAGRRAAHGNRNVSRIVLESEGAGYLRFPGHIWGHGLNNVLQEAILSAYLAYAANRSYVFEDYVWSHTPFPYTIYDFALRPARVPLNAFLNGPMAGGPMPLSSPSSSSNGNNHPPEAVSSEFYETVCPPSNRRIVSSRDSPNDAEGDKLVEWWVDRLAGVLDKCVEIDSSERVVFDKFLFGSPRILSLLPGLLSSPILANFQWSPLVLSAITRNWAVLRPENTAVLFSGGRGRGKGQGEITSSSSSHSDSSSLSSHSSSSSSTKSSTSSSTTSSSSSSQTHLAQFDSTLAVHIRRGDYKRHCPRLAQWGSSYMGIAQWAGLRDRFDPAGFEAGGKGNFSVVSESRTRDNGTTSNTTCDTTTTTTSSSGAKDDHDNHNHNDEEEEDDEADVPRTKEEYYLAHCLPSVGQIVRRLVEVKKEYEREGESEGGGGGRTLKKVYILTNGWSSWLSTLQTALLRAGFTEVISSYNLENNFDREQRYVGMAVDMAVAERAEVFVGNGFSSLSANIILLRAARGMAMNTNRLL